MKCQPTPEQQSEWHMMWRAAGASRVAEQLASSAWGNLVDEMGIEKREIARGWHKEYLSQVDNERLASDRRSWIAIMLSGIAIFVSILGLFIRASS